MKEKLFSLVISHPGRKKTAFISLAFLYVLFFCKLFSNRPRAGGELIDINVLNTIWKLKSMKISYKFRCI